MLLGLTEMLLSVADGGLTVTLNVVLTPEYAAVKVAGVEELTVPAVTVNVAEVEPAGTVTLEGTLAAVLLELASDTTTPPVPAASVRLTVPVPDWPLPIVPGFTDMLLKATGGLTVTANVALVPEYEAVKVAGVGAFIMPAVTVNVTEVEPCGTVTVEGTLAALVWELDSETAIPPVPAAAVRLTVPVAV
jgi:hypothetical protein